MTQDIQRELEAARTSVALADLPLGKLIFQGADRERFLQGLLTNDVAALAPGQGFKTCVLTPKGRFVADFFLYNRGEDFLALCRPESTAAITAALVRILPLSKTSMEDISRSWSSFYLQGPRAHAVASAVADIGALASGAHMRVSRQGKALEAVSYPAFSPDGTLLLIPGHISSELRSALLEASGHEPIVLGPEALEVLRVEAGVALPGKDFDADVYPLELNMEDALSFTKGCYMGQETVAYMKNRGHVNRKLIGLKLSDVIVPGSRIFSGSEAAGLVTSVVESARLKCPLGLALVRTPYCVSGISLEAVSQERRVQAWVVDLPLWGQT